jgi:Cu(I)/Ag(I) efflux system membrane fusion protein
VTSGQFLLDSESRLREAIAKFLGQKPAAAETPVLPASAETGTHAMNVAPPAKVDAVVAAYLPLAESLGTTQTDDTPLKVDALAAAIRDLSGGTGGTEPVRLLAGAAAAVDAMKGQTLDKQRERFKTVSASVIALVTTMPPSPSVAGSLYIVHCPMAKADWLQRTKEIANPYYADEMKECGSVVRTVGAKGAR